MAHHAAEGKHSRGIGSLFWGPGGAATLAGALEVLMFHPADTTSRRLMSYEKRVVEGGLAKSFRNALNVVLGECPRTPLAIIAHMYPGSFYAVCYKLSQRTIKFAGQPYVNDYLRHNHSASYQKWFGQRQHKIFMEATAGSIVAVLEISVLPFDRMKVLSQTNRKTIGSRGMIRIAAQEGVATLYAGACVAALRNVIGTSVLFGATAMTKEYVFHLQDYRKATLLQNMLCSTVGACLGVLCSSPVDVIKTRVQNKDLGSGVRGLGIFLSIMRKEGPSALFKGVIPKVLSSAPRLIFAYTATEYFTKALRKFRN